MVNPFAFSSVLVGETKPCPNYTPPPPSHNRPPQANHPPHTGGDSRLVIGGYILFEHIAQQGQDVFYLCAAPVRFPANLTCLDNHPAFLGYKPCT